MSGAVIHHLLSSGGLLSLGLYHLAAASHTFLKSPRDYSAKPFHPLPFSNPRLRRLPLYIATALLLLSLLLHLISSAIPDPLIKGSSPVHLFTSLQSSAVLFLFLLLTLFVLLSDSSVFPSDLIFAAASAAFYLQASASAAHSASVSTSSTLESTLDSLSSRISALSSILSLLLAFFPRLFVADLGLSATFCLQGFWILQTGLSLHVDAFIPEGCHRLLDVVGGVEGSTACQLDESKFRAVAILDLMFAIYVVIVVVLAFSTYAIVAKAMGVTGTISRRLGSYEPLPTTVSPAGVIDNNHVQLKTITGNQE